MASVEETIKTSRGVIKDCCVENGAIVAANTDKNYYPPNASPYRYVWPRDASFICVAADLLNIKIQENFFRWCLERAEGFREDGVFLQRYHTNGLRDGNQFQPDQTGSVLWAVWHHYRHNLEDALEFRELIEKGAEGLCRLWNGRHFTTPTYDLWEERSTFPDLQDNHTYSLAACAGGLRCANKIIENRKWIQAADEMENQIRESHIGYLPRTSGKICDEAVDSSLLGTIYPFNVFKPTDQVVKASIDAVEKRVTVEGGVYRYEFDRYDGWVSNGCVRRKGGGAWPVLNFWMSISCSLMGDEENAEKYYRWVLDRTDGHLPEQIFRNKLQKSVSPLGWSHAMFIIASHYLDRL